MIPIRVLTDNDVRSILDIKNTVACVEKAYALKCSNYYHSFSEGSDYEGMG